MPAKIETTPQMVQDVYSKTKERLAVVGAASDFVGKDYLRSSG